MALLSIDIGTDSCKIALREGTKIRTVSSRLPKDMIEDSRSLIVPHIMGSFLSKMRRKNHIHQRNCVLVLDEKQVFFRHISLPAMTLPEITLNLPYEFRDFIKDDPKEYNYDFIVDKLLYDGQDLKRLELCAAACSKKDLAPYEMALQKAGFHLVAAIPSQTAYGCLIAKHFSLDTQNAAVQNMPQDEGFTQDSSQQNPGLSDAAQEKSHDIILLDIAHKEIVALLYHNARFEASKTIDLGCGDLDNTIAELKGIDPYTARNYKHSNFEGVLDSPQCHEIYNYICLEISKTINFYNFNHPDYNIDALYFLGGGSQIPQLTQAISQFISIPTYDVAELLPPKLKTYDGASAYTLAVAGLLEGEAS